MPTASSDSVARNVVEYADSLSEQLIHDRSAEDSQNAKRLRAQLASVTGESRRMSVGCLSGRLIPPLQQENTGPARLRARYYNRDLFNPATDSVRRQHMQAFELASLGNSGIGVLLVLGDRMVPCSDDEFNQLLASHSWSPETVERLSNAGLLSRTLEGVELSESGRTFVSALKSFE